LFSANSATFQQYHGENKLIFNEMMIGQTKDYKIGIYGFSTKHAALRRKSKDWLAQNRDNVSEMSISELLFQ
jgi:ribosomal protein S17E